MSVSVTPHAIGAALNRLDGPLKVRGAATYAFEWPVDNPTYMYPLQAEIAVGRITAVDAAPAMAEDGVLVVLTHENAPELADAGDAEVAVLHTPEVAFRGQPRSPARRPA
jgi:xanthine dehydrogenase YagR molybdenum-binding subunit